MTIIGGVTNYGKLVTLITYGTKTETFLEFCRRLSQEVDLNDSFIVMDNHRAHYARVVTNFFGGFRNCRLLYLPPVTSIFNPIETVWAEVKRL